MVPLQRVPINNFRGGLNTRDGPFDLQPNESPDLSNVTLSDLVGSLSVRKGKVRFDTNSPAHTIDNARQTVLTNSGATVRFLMCSINGSIYSCDGTGAFVLLFIGTAGTVWDFAQMPDASGNDRVWCSNAVDAAQKWDGTSSTTSAWSGVPLAGTRLLVWRNKMIIVGVIATPQNVYLSKVGDPEATTAAYDFVQLRGDDDELDSITEINVLADRLYIFKQRSIWLMTDPVSFANHRIGEPGCYSQFQSDVCDDKLYFFNEQGVWSTAGVAVNYETGSMNSYFPNNLDFSQLAKVRVLGTRDSYPRVLVTLPTGSVGSNNVMLEMIPNMNFRRIGGRRYLLLPAFMLHTYDASCLANFKPTDVGEWGIYGGSSSVNKLYQYFTGSSDDGVQIDAHWKSAWMAIEGEEPFERVRRLNVELSGDAIVDIFKDFNVSPDFSATLPGGTVGSDNTWDNSPNVWDGGTWDPEAQYRFARVRPESRGRFHQVQFRTLPTGLPFAINVAELAIRGGKEH